MKNNSVYKKKGKLLSEDDRAKYSSMITYCREWMEKHKKKAADLEDINAKSRVIIKKHEDKINKIEIPATGGVDPYPHVKQGIEELGSKVIISKAIIKHESHKIFTNKTLIRQARNDAVHYWRELKKYKDLLTAGKPWHDRD